MAGIEQDQVDIAVLVAQHRQRMAGILEGYAQANAVRRDTDPPVLLPPDIEARALVGALIRVLIEKGAVTDAELMPHKCAQLEGIAEMHLERVLEQRNGRSGIVGPHGELL